MCFVRSRWSWLLAISQSVHRWVIMNIFCKLWRNSLKVFLRNRDSWTDRQPKSIMPRSVHGCRWRGRVRKLTCKVSHHVFSSRLVCREFFTPSAATCSTLPPPSNWCLTTSLTTSTGARQTSGGSPDTPTSRMARWLTGPPACWWVEAEGRRDLPNFLFLQPSDNLACWSSIVIDCRWCLMVCN